MLLLLVFRVSTSQPVPEPLSSTEQACWLSDQVQPHEMALRGYLRHQFPSVDVDDVVQESYLKLLRIQATGRITFAKAYFFSVARNTALKIFRRRQQLYSELPISELPDWQIMDGGPTAADITNANQLLELVAEAIDLLPVRCREIISLAILHGLSSAEIAAQLTLSENTVRVQTARGIKKCAEYLRTRNKPE